MEKFLKSKVARNVSAQQRHAKFRTVSGSKLFCTPCILILDHTIAAIVECLVANGIKLTNVVTDRLASD